MQMRSFCIFTAVEVQRTLEIARSSSFWLVSGEKEDPDTPSLKKSDDRTESDRSSMVCRRLESAVPAKRRLAVPGIDECAPRIDVKKRLGHLHYLLAATNCHSRDFKPLRHSTCSNLLCRVSPVPQMCSPMFDEQTQTAILRL